LPDCFRHLRRLLELCLNKHGRREYIQVLRLLETFALEEVSAAIDDALRMNTISFDAVRHLVLCRIERRPPRYERAATLVTSNLPFEEWTEVFGSERLTGALLDRLTHHVHILEMNGDSYRLKQSRRKRNPPADH
jgi:DNA replication protein DnaC